MKTETDVKPKPWICCFCGQRMLWHTMKPTGCGWKIVCPPAAALSGKEE